MQSATANNRVIGRNKKVRYGNMQIRHKSSSENFSCPYCRTSYLVTREEIPGVDESHFVCITCGKEIRKWRGAYILTFSLVKASVR
jgi:predicted Zn finger-like uncharacterized protein